MKQASVYKILPFEAFNQYSSIKLHELMQQVSLYIFVNYMKHI